MPQLLEHLTLKESVRLRYLLLSCPESQFTWWVTAATAANWTPAVDRLNSISYACSQDLFEKFCMRQCKNNGSQKGSETVNVRVIRAKQLATESHQESSYSCTVQFQ